ncbi:hypothetical protein KC19_2G077200 [Ceratodon purpureus]|uniref:Uncharacterized protein n=1 Tax=Ceratodon purpureus TaxID=3225 RepID=A0A8T0ITY7_CERPU|nr:hypothetical protein KC19_2G077200 [Ceratodon purpureus]
MSWFIILKVRTTWKLALIRNTEVQLVAGIVSCYNPVKVGASRRLHSLPA